MGLYEKIVAKEEKIAVTGLGYVGMPIAVEFAKKVKVIGYDSNAAKVKAYQDGVDPTCEVGDEAIAASTVEFSSDENKLKEAKFHIIAVPTPINTDKTPDLAPVRGASEVVGRNLIKGSIVVYESTVYPGVTEDVCVPILEKESGLKSGVDFKVGYSPERINPGDKLHRLTNIKKIVSGMDAETLDEIAKVYELVIEAGVHRASTIKVAEAAKVVENSQRDINIAFINELAMAFDKMGINTKEVIDAMNTKWNALGFMPGLVGGHCIGVDPYYFVYEAEKLGYHSQIISAGRRVNDDMPIFIARKIIKALVKANKQVKAAKVVFFGATFKEDCPDARNSKIMDVYYALKDYGLEPIMVDCIADAADVKRTYGIELADIEDAVDADCLILGVAHKKYKDKSLDDYDKFFKAGLPNEEKVIIDIKSMLNREEVEKRGYTYWNL